MREDGGWAGAGAAEHVGLPGNQEGSSSPFWTSSPSRTSGNPAVPGLFRAFFSQGFLFVFGYLSITNTFGKNSECTMCRFAGNKFCNSFLAFREWQLVKQAVGIRQTSALANTLIAGPCPRLEALHCGILSAMTSKHISNLFIHLSPSAFAGPVANTFASCYGKRKALRQAAQQAEKLAATMH